MRVAALIIFAVLLLLAALIGLGRWRFARASARAVRELLGRVPEAPVAPLLAAQLDRLPAVVRAWIVRSGAVGRERPRVVHIHQRGRMRTTKTGRWMPFRAEQWFTPTAPGFVWTVDVRAAPGVHLFGRDVCIAGRGSMRIELLAVAPVVAAHGPRIDEGALVRYLAEMIWFPAHALGSAIRWEPVTARSARATLTVGETTVSGVFTFTPWGDFERFEASRYLDEQREPWQIDVEPGAHGELGGLRVPLRASVTWRLADGPWTWLHLEVLDRSELATSA